MPEQFEQGIEVADVYAAALFELAREADQLQEVRDELGELAELVRTNNEFARFVSSAVVDDDDRRESLEKIFRGKLSDMTLNTLLVMNDHDRAAFLPQLERAFVLRLEHERGQVEVAARSAVELSNEQKQNVERIAQKLSGRKPLVEYTVDPDLIGGLVLQIGDHRLDSSIRWQLSAAHQRLIDRGDRGFGRELHEAAN